MIFLIIAFFINLILAIGLMVLANKVGCLNTGKKCIICGAVIYFVLSIATPLLLFVVGVRFFIVLIIECIGLLLATIGIIKSLIGKQTTSDKTKEEITNILD